MKKALGLESITDESVRDKIESITKDKDSAKRIQDLTDALSAKDDEISTQAQGYKDKFDGMQVNASLSKGIDAVSKTLVDDPLLRDAFKVHISKNIGLVGDAVVPFTIVGDAKVPVMVNGVTQTVEDYAKTVLAGESFGSFRKPSVGNSPGKPGEGGSNTASDMGGNTQSRTSAIEQMIAAG